MSWDQARLNCRCQHGGDLVSISSAEEDQWLVANPLAGGNDVPAWIGLSDYAVEGEYKWSDGTTYNYTNWKTSQPNDKDNSVFQVRFLHVIFSGTNDSDLGPTLSSRLSRLINLHLHLTPTHITHHTALLQQLISTHSLTMTHRCRPHSTTCTAPTLCILLRSDLHAST